MDGAVFYSYKPYLHLALSRECIITFNESSTWKNTRRIITMRIKTLDIMVKKSVTVMAENDEKLEEKREKIIRGVIYENLHKSEYCNNSVEVSAIYQEK